MRETGAPCGTRRDVLRLSFWTVRSGRPRPHGRKQPGGSTARDRRNRGRQTRTKRVARARCARGWIRSPGPSARPERGIPRARGDEAGLGCDDFGIERKSPARAGMNRRKREASTSAERLPRTRGDEPSPQGRGQGPQAPLPRARGDEPCIGDWANGACATARHARGGTMDRVRRSGRPEATPARAGTNARDPHTRGEHLEIWSARSHNRSFPRARGDDHEATKREPRRRGTKALRSTDAGATWTTKPGTERTAPEMPVIR